MTLPDDLNTPFEADGSAVEVMLHPRAVGMMSGASPEEVADTYGYDIGGHRIVWRVHPWSTPEERERSLEIVVDGEPAGDVRADVLDEAKFHQGRNKPRISLWHDEATCEVTTTGRTSSGRIPRRTSTSVVPCYQLCWRTKHWVMAMEDFPKTFGLWVGSATDGINGAPLATYTRRKGKTPAELTWSRGATLLDAIMCLTRGFHGDFTHLAGTKAQIAYSIATDLSL